jgi:hypothetical protein
MSWCDSSPVPLSLMGQKHKFGWNPQGKRRPGAPKATWRRTVMKECQLNVRTENLYKLSDKASNKLPSGYARDWYRLENIQKVTSLPDNPLSSQTRTPWTFHTKENKKTGKLHVCTTWWENGVWFLMSFRFFLYVSCNNIHSHEVIIHLFIESNNTSLFSFLTYTL